MGERGREKQKGRPISRAFSVLKDLRVNNADEGNIIMILLSDPYYEYHFVLLNVNVDIIQFKNIILLKNIKLLCIN